MHLRLVEPLPLLPPPPPPKKERTVLVICVSDYRGHEEYTVPFKQLSHDECVELTRQILEDEPEAMASIFEVPWAAWLQYKREGYPHHSSHWLSKHGKELCLGDYLG